MAQPFHTGQLTLDRIYIYPRVPQTLGLGAVLFGKHKFEGQADINANL